MLWSHGHALDSELSQYLALLHNNDVSKLSEAGYQFDDISKTRSSPSAGLSAKALHKQALPANIRSEHPCCLQKKCVVAACLQGRAQRRHLREPVRAAFRAAHPAQRRACVRAPLQLHKLQCVEKGRPGYTRQGGCSVTHLVDSARRGCVRQTVGRTDSMHVDARPRAIIWLESLN